MDFFDQEVTSKFSGVELRTSRWNLKSSIGHEHYEKHAEAYNVSSDMLDFRKRLFDKDIIPQPIKDARACVGSIRKTWIEATRPTISRGIRMIKLDDIAAFRNEINSMREVLEGHVKEINDTRDDWIEMAKSATMGLFDESDYPVDVSRKFRIGFTIRSLEPDERLKQMDKGLYDSLHRQYRMEMEAAAQLATQELAKCLSNAIDLMVGNLQGDSDGQLKRFGPRNIERLTEFFDRFDRVKDSSLDDISHIVDQAKDVVSGVNVSLIKDSPTIRQQVQESFAGITDSLDSLMENAPRRNIRVGDELE